MKEIMLDVLETPILHEPILIEGLPGVGNVGKIAAEHLIDELKAKKFAVMHSKFFPPQVLVSDEGVIRMVSNDFYYYKHKKQDLLFLAGDYQGLTPDGQYELAFAVLEVAKQYGVKRIFTLGGYGIGKMVKEPRVLGAATSPQIVEEMKALGVVFKKGEPGSGIVGASGLLLGLGMLQGMEGVCLMGETSGYFVDPKSAQCVLSVLTKILDVQVDFSKLENKAEQVDKLTTQIKEIENPHADSHLDDLRYIG